VSTATKTLTENTTNTGTKLQVLRALQDKPDMTQRELAQKLGVSVGRVNYCIKALVDKGYVKVGNFTASNNKLRYAYILTPSGVAEKAGLTTAFIARKLSEYHALRAEIGALVKAGEIDADELPGWGVGESR
jgi:EPS-associated MarR family transcriptional regulator